MMTNMTFYIIDSSALGIKLVHELQVFPVTECTKKKKGPLKEFVLPMLIIVAYLKMCVEKCFKWMEKLKCSVNLFHISLADYTAARTKLIKAEVTSDLQMDPEPERAKHKRK